MLGGRWLPHTGLVERNGDGPAAAAVRYAQAVDKGADTARNLSYAERAAVQSELRDFLTASSRVLSRTAPWLPYRRLDSGFAERFVRVSDQAPTPDPWAERYRPAQIHGCSVGVPPWRTQMEQHFWPEPGTGFGKGRPETSGVCCPASRLR